jgi:hypothetical protein
MLWQSVCNEKPHKTSNILPQCPVNTWPACRHFAMTVIYLLSENSKVQYFRRILNSGKLKTLIFACKVKKYENNESQKMS